MNRARCRECGHTFETRKSPEERSSPLRCGECNSRDVEPLAEPAGDGVAARAFRRFREEGASPLELVEAGLCDPAEARRLRDEFNDLARGEFVLLSEAELAERIEAAKTEVREEEEEKRSRAVRRAREEASGEFNQQLNQQLTAARRRARREGYSRGWEDGEETTRTALEADMEAELEAAVEAIEEKYRGEVSRIREAISALEAENERLREERDELAERVESLMSGDVGAVYAEGFSDGVLAAPVESEAWSAGAAAVLGSTAAGR